MAFNSPETELLQDDLLTKKGKSMSLLVLHDYSISCQKWRESLRKMFDDLGGFNIRIPESRREALELLKTEPVDMITIELQFGEKSLDGTFDDGSSFAAAAREVGFKGTIAFTTYPIAPEEN